MFGIGLTELIIVLVVLVPYFIPAIVGRLRRHPNAVAIFALNLLLGWTVLGWVAALVWGLTNPRPSEGS